jgi:hypothetical protein
MSSGYLLFDLHGPIIDPASAIIDSVHETMRKLGAKSPDANCFS